MNHRTTTTLLVVIAVATLLVAGIVVPIVRSNHSAFAHKNYDKFNKEDKSGRDGNQYLKCIVVENGGISDNSCNNHDGATPTPTIPPIPVGCPATTILDVTLQAALGTAIPSGATLCLTAALGFQDVIVIVPSAVPFNEAVVVSLAEGGQCPSDRIAAAITSVGPGGLPTPIPPTATIVCVAGAI